MKTGKTIEQLAAEIQRQANAKRDFVVPTQVARMKAETAATETGLVPMLTFGDQRLTIGDTAHKQIGEHVGIPARYYEKMRTEAPDLLADNVNRWFDENPAKRMVRTLDGRARGFMSDSFRPLDNVDLAEAILPVIMEMGVEPISMEITERRLYMKVVDRSITRELPVGAEMGKGHTFVKCRELHPIVTISNSEIGFGALSIQGGVLDDFCTNLSVFRERSMRKYHVGSKFEIAEGDIYAMLSDETKRLDNAAIWSKARDVLKGAFDAARFDALVDKIKSTQDEKVAGGVPEVVEVTAKKFGFNEAERKSVLDFFIKGADLSRFGLYNAVTRTAEDLTDYDRASEFEKVGGEIIELPQSEWRVISEGNVKALKIAA